MPPRRSENEPVEDIHTTCKSVAFPSHSAKLTDVFTTQGAIGIAGLVAAIYPVESPGGYQLYGRTLPPWQTWGQGDGFEKTQPWLLRPFDQVGIDMDAERVCTLIAEYL